MAHEDDQAEQELGQALLAACQGGDWATAQQLLAQGAPAYYQEEAGGTSCLMHAAQGAHLEIVQALLAASAPWNALDRQGKCAGEYAMASEAADAARRQAVVDALVDHAVIAEMLLGTMGDAEAVAAQQQESEQYLEGRVRYEKDKLVDEAEEGVMMEWEAPLMEAHAQLLCGEAGDRDVMNVGFGMGIIDSAIQRLGCKSHTILEAHPDVLAKMEADGWPAKPGVAVEAGRWQDVLPRLVAQGKKYDAIFYDTYSEHYRVHQQVFHEWLPKLLRPGGIYSYFNGLAPDNIFFHAVTCQLVKLELESLGFDPVDFATVEVEGGVAEEGTWEGLRRRYWHGRTEYYLPVAIYQGGNEGDEEVAGGKDEATIDVGEDGVQQDEDNEEVPTSHEDDDAMADDTLVGEAEVEGEGGESTVREVLLHASLDPQAGGLAWRPHPDLCGRTDPVCLLQLRCWYPPMLHDVRRHQLFRQAIQGTVRECQQQGDAKGLTVLDIGTGTSLLSLEAVRAGASRVVACEVFPALAAVAQQVVRANGMEDKVEVLSKRSTDVTLAEVGGRPVDLVVSELLDSTLLGEGYLSTLRDLYARGLVSSTTRVLPARARVWAQLVQCPALPSHWDIAFARSSSTTACTGGGRPLPLYMAPPSAADAGGGGKRKASDASAGGPIPSVALSAPFPLLDLDFAALAGKGDETNGPMVLGATASVPVVASGSLHGVLMWWELTLSDDTEEEETYSSIPRDPATDPLWQDHWKPCVWPVASPMAVQAGTTVAVQGAHDDQTVWVDVLQENGGGGSNNANNGSASKSQAMLQQGPSPCTCGMHGAVPVERVLALNDARRRDAYHRALQHVVREKQQGRDDHEESPPLLLLDICDGAFAATALHDDLSSSSSTTPPPKEKIKMVSLEQHPWHAAVLKQQEGKGGRREQASPAQGVDLVVWQGVGAGEAWDAEAWGQEVQVLCGDGYYAKIGLNRPVWSWLNFWVLRTALAPVLARNVVVLPFQARLMAAVVECPALYRVHGGGQPVDDAEVGGWDHDAYRQAVRAGEAKAACDEDKDLPVALADHPHRFLTPPALVMRLDLHRAIDWRAPRGDDGAYRRTTIQVPFEKPGHAHALAMWVEVDLTYQDAVDGGGGGGEGKGENLPRHARQTLRWLGGGQVGDGNGWWGVEIKGGMDLVDTPGVWTECRLIAVAEASGGGGGMEDEMDERSECN